MEKPKRMRFLDLGFGKAERIAFYASKPRSKKRFFLGIDSKKTKGIAVPKSQRNVKLVFGSNVRKLRAIKARSFDALNMDFFPVIRKVATGSPQARPGEKQMLVPEELNIELLKHAERVLREKGRLYLTVPMKDVVDMAGILKSHGFSEVRYKEVPEENRNITSTMAKYFKLADTDPTEMPYRIVAVKRTN